MSRGDRQQLMRPPSSVWLNRGATVAVLWLALILRLHRLGGQSLWSDEGNSLALAQAGFADIARRTALDIHPPLYYWLLKLNLAAFGHSEFAARFLSTALSLLLVAVVIALGRRLFGPTTGVLAGLLTTVAPFQVYYAQEARMYSLLALLGGLSFYFAHLVWQSNSSAQRKVSGLGYVLAATAGLYSQYAFPALLAALNLGALLFLYRQPRRLLSWIGWQVPPVLLYLPWLPIAYRQLTTWPRSLLVDATAADIAQTLLATLSFGPIAAAMPGSVSITLAALAALAAIWGLATPPTRRNTALILFYLLLPLLLTTVLFRPAYLKFLLSAAPAWALLLALGLSRLAGLHRRAGLASSAVMLSLVLLVQTQALQQLYHQPQFQRDDYRYLARYIEAAGTSDDAVILFAPGQQEVFRYYYAAAPNQPTVYPLPRSRPINETETRTILEGIASQHEQIFGVFWATQEADPNGIIEAWLNANTFQAEDRWVGNLRLVRYAAPANPGPLIPLDPTPALGDNIRLNGYRLNQDTLAPGQLLALSLIWQSDLKPEHDYTVFVQLLDANNHLIAQRDAALQPPANTWQPGQPIEDRHGLGLQLGTPPGPARLIVGLYDSATGRRLTLPDGGDHIALATLGITPPPSAVPAAAFQVPHPFPTGPLLGYDLRYQGRPLTTGLTVASGTPFHLTLYWATATPQAQADTLSIILQGPDGAPAQTWSAPAAGISLPMADWPPNMPLRAQFTRFVGDVPPGRYRIDLRLGEMDLGHTHWFRIDE